MYTKNKEFPPGTFIPTPYRVLAIIQLCLAFTAVLSALGEPFMGELFALKSRKLLHETLIKQEDLLSLLPEEDQKMLEQNYKELTVRVQTPLFEKGKRALKILLFDLPAFERAWILFSIVLPILLLLKVEGAPRACWLLVLISLVCLIDSFLLKIEKGEEKLFPSEELLITKYLNGPLSPRISEQHQQLLRGWHLYLIHEWAQEIPSDDSLKFKQQVRKGDFQFTLARIKEERVLFPKKRHSSTILGIFLVWNFFFAWFMNLRRSQRPSSKIIPFQSKSV